MTNRHGMPVLDRAPVSVRRTLVETPKPQTKTVDEREVSTFVGSEPLRLRMPTSRHLPVWCGRVVRVLYIGRDCQERTMSAVSPGDQAKVLAMVGTGSARRDELLLGLVRELSWTPAQRDLLERMWTERQQQREGAMKKKAVLCVGFVAVLALVSGCAATYEKRFIDHDGKPVVIREHHDPDWWNNIGTPDWMNVRHETILRDGKIIADRDCEHDAGSPTVLDCMGK